MIFSGGNGSDSQDISFYMSYHEVAGISRSNSKLRPTSMCLFFNFWHCQFPYRMYVQINGPLRSDHSALPLFHFPPDGGAAVHAPHSARCLGSEPINAPDQPRVADGVLKLQVEDRAGVGTTGTPTTHSDDESLNSPGNATDLDLQNPIARKP